MDALPVSVVILTKNEERRIAETLRCLRDFDDIWVVDSHSDDQTKSLAQRHGAEVVDFQWNGQYPKKKQWALDNLALKHDWVLLLDADERMRAGLVQEIKDLFSSGQPKCDGYFITGLYRINEKILRFGQKNKKLMLLNREKFSFPEIQDIGFEGGWEVEGHYQPIPKGASVSIGLLSRFLIHDAFDDVGDLLKRHDNYAAWEALMSYHHQWPADPGIYRQCLKVLFRALPIRGTVIFVYSYIWKFGFLDGRYGLMFARQRAAYYRNVVKRLDLLRLKDFL